MSELPALNQLQMRKALELVLRTDIETCRVVVEHVKNVHYLAPEPGKGIFNPTHLFMVKLLAHHLARHAD